MTSSVVIEEAGEQIGVVGATVPTIRSISSPGADLGIFPEDFDANPTDAQLDALAAEIQFEVDALLAANPDMNKVILLSHMQQLSIELALAERLEGVDIIVAGGSNTRLFDDNDRARDGDSDQGQYPQFVTNAGGTTTAVVNTDGNYKYVGRLVIDFDEDGNILADSYDQDISGAFATDDQGVADLGAESLIDPEIDAITDAIQAEIIATESNVFGVSDVFLNGNRSGTFTADDPDGVRTQETNLGNLTADANLDYAQGFDADVVISIKNGGGIRANIGQVVVPAGGTEAVRTPNEEILDENGNVVKPEGGISQNDIATTLAFNNGLTLLDATRAELVAFLEGSIGALPGGSSGGFPQIAGLKFSFDETQPVGDRVISAGVFDGDVLVAELVRDGEITGDATESFRIVTLNFLANSGDPVLSTLSNPNRVDLIDLDADGNDDESFTGAATFAADGSEQDALAEYLNDNFNPDNGGVAFNEADTGPALDDRIQNLTFRADTILPDVVDPAAFTLSLLHFADQEANAATIGNIDNLSGVLNVLRDEDVGADGVLTLSSGDAIIPGLFFDASAAVFGSQGIADIQIQNELGVEAIALGNHEFDLGTGLLAGLIDGSALGDFSALTTGTAIDGQDFLGANFPYLSTNLDFSTDPNLAPLAVAGGAAPQANTVTSSVVIEEAGEQIGVVGATVPTIRSISSPGADLGIFPEDFDANPTDAQLDALAAEIQFEVDALLAANPDMNKVILLSHMQQLSIELALAERLEGVDIIVAGGSNTRLFDDNDRARDGDSDQGQYPQFVTNAGGTTTAVVNTDGNYKYVGRLVIDFDEDGNILADSYDQDISGAFATDDQGVADLGAESLIDAEIDAITDAIQAEIIATESNVFGVSDVFLNGNRSGTFTADDPDGVRTQETNLGNLTADANLDYAQGFDADVVISIKNGGGIRANIGQVVVPAGGTEAVRTPNEEILDENGNVVKPEGGISQNDIATTLAFNNGLTLLDATRAELVAFLEGSIGALPGGSSGGFPQIAGLKFSFDETQPVGDRVISAGVFDGDVLVAELVRDGEITGDATESFRIVTLNFLANSGDPVLSTLSNPNRVDLIDLDADGNDDESFTGAATFAADGSEQDALAEYLNDNFNPDNGGVAFNEADTGPALDDRIQNLTFRADTILPEVVDPAAFTLSLLHFADQEANAATIGNIDNLSGVLNVLRDEDVGADGVLTLSSGDAIIPGLFFDASAAVFGSQGIADIQIQNELGVEAIALGNHEFDLGTGLLAGLIDGSAVGDFSALTTGTAIDGQDFLGANFPYLSTNLDFSTDPNLAPLAVAGGAAPQANTVTSSVVIEEAGEQIGVVGATVPTIRSISSPGADLGIFPEDFDANPTDAQLDALAAEIQFEVDALLAANPDLNKVILLSHMQQLSIELALAERLEGVDIIVAGGSNTRLFDDNDRARDGDSDQGQYPQFVTNAGGTTTAVVNTDGNYKYVGRLVIDFDEDGNILADSYDQDISGAFATDDQGVADLGAESLIDPEIDAITDAIQAEIIATESNVFGVSDVFLNGNRSGTFTADDPDGVRTQETNLGNLTADANLDYAQGFDADVVISIKNGGGIRANIGQVVVPAGGTEAVRTPNEEILDENGNVVKPEGGISQNDIATTLAFNNGLTLLDATRAELVAFLEGSIGALPSGSSGGFPQIAGLKFSFDETQPVGDRVISAGVFDGDVLVAELVRDGEITGDATESFRIVTLNFLANSGDPVLSTLSNPNRVDLIDLDADGNDDESFTGAATFAADGSEQDALAEYLNDNFNPDNGGVAFNEADTGPALDDRIQNLTFRADTILPDVVDPAAFTLSLLHFADQEANAATIGNIDNLSGVLNVLRDEDVGADGVLTLSSGDAIIPGLFFDASAAVFGSQGIADIQIQNELGVEAIALGNHEFDLGTGLLAGLIDGSAVGDFSALTTGTAIDGQDFLGANFPYLSTNLDFSTDPNLAPLAVAGGAAPQANTVTSSVVIEEAGEQIGVVGATVPTIRSISSPGADLGIFPEDFDANPTDAQLDALAAEIQFEVDALLFANPDLNKVILLSHMQQLSIELALAERLEGVDIIVAGGSNTRLFDDNDRARDGDSDQGQYPQFVTNAGGTTTAVVNTDGIVQVCRPAGHRLRRRRQHSRRQLRPGHLGRVRDRRSGCRGSRRREPDRCGDRRDHRRDPGRDHRHREQCLRRLGRVPERQPLGHVHGGRPGRGAHAGDQSRQPDRGRQPRLRPGLRRGRGDLDQERRRHPGQYRPGGGAGGRHRGRAHAERGDPRRERQRGQTRRRHLPERHRDHAGVQQRADAAGRDPGRAGGLPRGLDRRAAVRLLGRVPADRRAEVLVRRDAARGRPGDLGRCL